MPRRPGDRAADGVVEAVVAVAEQGPEEEPEEQLWALTLTVEERQSTSRARAAAKEMEVFMPEA